MKALKNLRKEFVQCQQAHAQLIHDFEMTKQALESTHRREMVLEEDTKSLNPNLNPNPNPSWFCRKIQRVLEGV